MFLGDDVGHVKRVPDVNASSTGVRLHWSAPLIRFVGATPMSLAICLRLSYPSSRSPEINVATVAGPATRPGRDILNLLF